jgi:phenylalanyl-tRNA synthetase beta chain
MIVSWKWLNQYVDLKMSHDELVDRLTMSGLNHEGTEKVDGDKVLDLEVTSNRPDCLGHLGVAREIAVLFELPLKIPDPAPNESGDPITRHCSVEIKCPDLCYRYTARLIRGVKIGPSPDWLLDRLEAIGVAPVNNIVDITNYVMFECGQPLHAFDFAKVSDGKIIVRPGGHQEKMEAIDHKTYELLPLDCIIADSTEPVAIGGVMGGADSEINDQTTDVLIEAAYFNQLAVRNTARRLKLFSPSSFRFERDINSAGIDWASRRASELILELAGGKLCQGVIDVGQPPNQSLPIKLRLNQIERLLGIAMDEETSAKILSALGLTIDEKNGESIVATPPSWRKDLTREVDLIEEVGRVYGYDKISDSVDVPMSASIKHDYERSLDKVRTVLTAAGFDEAITSSVIPDAWSQTFSPWTDQPAHQISQPMLGVLEKASQNVGAVDRLRRSIVPSLLEVRRINEYKFNPDVHLFETAKVYLPADSGLPAEPWKIALVSDGDYFDVKGVVETLVAQVNPACQVTTKPCNFALFDGDKSAALTLDKKTLGYVGEVSASGKRSFGLRRRATVCEVDFAVLVENAVLIPQFEQLSHFPPVIRDFNFVVENKIHWDDIEATVRQSGGELLESITFKEIFRDEQRDGADKKRVLLSIVLRSNTDTLTGEKADAVSQVIVKQCEQQLGATLLT